jgi:cyclase
MERERITEDIYVFTSDLYAQVTAGAILTDDGAVLIDTLVYPEETRQIRRFVQDRLGATIRYVINTHFHADHTTGTCFFPDAQVIAHERCRALLDKRGRESIDRLRTSAVEMRDVSLVLPDIVFNDALTMRLGNKTLRMWSAPGHSPDSIVCMVEQDQVLFAADAVMPVPYFVDGDFDDFLASLEALREHTYEIIVQGHGEIVLRGEIEEKIQSDIDYLVQLRQAVEEALSAQQPEQVLDGIELEKCGKSRAALNGAVQQLHRQNVLWLADRLRSRQPTHVQNGQ